MPLMRTAVVVVAVVAMLPSDRAQQERLQQSLADAAHWAVTICDRQPQLCAMAASGWETFKAKAEFAFVVAYDLAVQHAFGRGPDISVSTPATTGSTGTRAAPLPEDQRRGHRGTLTPRDLEPHWRGVAISADDRRLAAR
jgi:hypothetical protein